MVGYRAVVFDSVCGIVGCRWHQWVFSWWWSTFSVVGAVYEGRRPLLWWLGDFSEWVSVEIVWFLSSSSEWSLTRLSFLDDFPVTFRRRRSSFGSRCSPILFWDKVIHISCYFGSQDIVGFGWVHPKIETGSWYFKPSQDWFSFLIGLSISTQCLLWVVQ